MERIVYTIKEDVWSTQNLFLTPTKWKHKTDWLGTQLNTTLVPLSGKKCSTKSIGMFFNTKRNFMLNSQSFNSFMNTSGEDFCYKATSLNEIIRTVEILEEADEELYDLDYITEEEYA